jgi:hypothetical protein
MDPHATTACRFTGNIPALPTAVKADSETDGQRTYLRSSFDAECSEIAAQDATQAVYSLATEALHPTNLNGRLEVLACEGLTEQDGRCHDPVLLWLLLLCSICGKKRGRYRV